MVYPDFSFSEDPIQPSSRVRIAPVADRLLAFLLDFFVLSPVIGLFATPLLRDLRTIQLVNPDANEATVLWAMMIAGVIGLVILLETASLLVWGATPGQKFLQLKVRDIGGAPKLEFGQALGRATLRWLSTPFVLPLLSVYTHPQRRALHDSGSDTLVTTLRENGDSGPVEMERNFFRSWGRMVLLFVVVSATVSVWRVRELLRDGEFTRAKMAEDEKICRDLPLTMPGIERLDRALAEYLAGAGDASCVEHEADGALWGTDAKLKAFAALAKGLVEDDKTLGAEYLKLACENEKTEACAIAHFAASKDDDRIAILRVAGKPGRTAQIFLLRESIDRGEVASAAPLIRELRRAGLFASFVDREEVRAMWSLREEHPGRAPASVDVDELRADFVKRYDLE